MPVYKLKIAICAAIAAALAANSATITFAQRAKAPASSSRGSVPDFRSGKDAILKYARTLSPSERIDYYRSLSYQAMAKAEEAQRLGNDEGARHYRNSATAYDSAAQIVRQNLQAARRKVAEDLAVKTRNCVPTAGKCVSLDSFVYIQMDTDGQPWTKTAYSSKDSCEFGAYQGHYCVAMIAREARRLNYSFR